MGESEKPVHGSNACPSLENVALHDPTPSTPACQLAAGEKQKVEILKELYLASHFLILDELAIGDWRMGSVGSRIRCASRHSLGIPMNRAWLRCQAPEGRSDRSPWREPWGLGPEWIPSPGGAIRMPSLCRPSGASTVSRTQYRESPPRGQYRGARSSRRTVPL